VKPLRNTRRQQEDDAMATATMPERTLDRVRPPYETRRIRWATVRIEAEAATYLGRVWVHESEERVSDILSDERLFVSLTEVSINGDPNVEPFVAVSKRCIRTMRVLEEGTLGQPAPRGGYTTYAATSIAPSR
jgi:hypothetical protein